MHAFPSFYDKELARKMKNNIGDPAPICTDTVKGPCPVMYRHSEMTLPRNVQTNTNSFKFSFIIKIFLFEICFIFKL